MSIIVEDGSGVTGAQSYITVAAFKAYCDSVGFSYEGKTDTQIEQALRRGTRFVDSRYRDRFLGRRTSGLLQPLEWPRQMIYAARASYRVNGLPYGATHLTYTADSAIGIASDVIPQEVKDASAEATWRELTTPNSLSPDYIESQRVISETIGPISTTYSNSQSGPQSATPVVITISDILGPVLRSSSMLMRA